MEFYEPGTNAVTCEQYYLNTSGHWIKVNGSDVTTTLQASGFFTRGFSITLPDTLPEAYRETTALDYNQVDGAGHPMSVPAKYWEPLLKVPTNGFSQIIATGSSSGRVKTNVYNLAALRLPVAAHPG